jgi:uncharacterized protein (DUF1501 family)
MKNHNIDRRKFLHQASCIAAGGSTMMSSILNLKSMKAMAENNSSILTCNDHKALVCLFNSGGLDAYNMLVPTTASEYSNYSKVRSDQALLLSSLRQIQPDNTPGRTFGLHPSLSNLQSLFNSGKAAFVSNIGALVAPITKQEFYDDKVATPLGLYSHSDQQMHWQTGLAHKREAVGWAGRMSDLLNSCNSNIDVSMNVSFSGSNILQTGLNSVEFSIDPQRPSAGIESDYVNPQGNWWYEKMKKNGLSNMMEATYMNVFEKTYKNTILKARDGVEDVQLALKGAPTFNNVFSNTRISKSFKLAAQMIAQHMTLGMNRQVFFIEYGGWDHHDELIETQAEMLAEMDKAIGEFNTAIQMINKQNNVLTFSISEFARTLSSNGNGTDHAWGTHVFTFGGPVLGRKIFGEYPSTLALNSSMEIGGGVIIPKLSAEQYLAEIAMWFGVPPSNLKDLFPNIGNFYSASSNTKPIGFLA